MSLDFSTPAPATSLPPHVRTRWYREMASDALCRGAEIDRLRSASRALRRPA